MGKFIDLKGQKYGKLTVLEKTDKRSIDGCVIWKCQCECGKILEVPSNSLRSGNTRSCGRCNKIEDLIGRKFGRLTVIKLDKNKSEEYKKAVWVCKCDCGNIVSIRASALKQGSTLSCGCLKTEKARELLKNKYNNLINQKFGFLTPISKTDKRTSSGVVIWKCLCDCGNIVEVSSSALTSGHTISCGCFKGSKGEKTISEILNKNNINFKKQYTFKDLKGVNNGLLRFDFGVLDTNNNLICLIEYNGIQHYDKNNPYYHEEIVKHDEIKKEYCLKNNIKLFEIDYNEDINNKMKKVINFIQKERAHE